MRKSDQRLGRLAHPLGDRAHPLGDRAQTMKTKLVVTGLTPGQTYYFRFRAHTRKGDIDYSQVVSLMVH